MAKKKPEKIKVTCPFCKKRVKARVNNGTIINHTKPQDNPHAEKERCNGSGFHIQSRETV